MAYIQVEASVRTHRKFLKAGPAASWLWLCGVGYCQDGLTDGFIPFEAIDFLGIKGTTARKLKVTLVAVGLWDEVPGGWRVHDYLKHNKSADTVNAGKKEKRVAGAAGGRASGEARREASASASASAVAEAPLEAPREPISTLLISSPSTSQPLDSVSSLDVWFSEFTALYPESRRRADRLASGGVCGRVRGRA